MENLRPVIIYSWISLVIFIFSIAPAALYYGEIREPMFGGPLLLFGWLGPWVGYFSWYANLFYFVSLVTAKKIELSLFFALIALALSLSFLGYDKIPLGHNLGYATIYAYGWGYVLWVLSFGIWATFQLANCIFKKSRKNTLIKSLLLEFGFIVIVATVFSNHYCFGDNAQYQINKKRKVIFEEQCRIAETHIYKHTERVESIFFESNRIIKYKRGKNRLWWSKSGGYIGNIILHSGYIEFFEIANDKTNSHNPKIDYPYRRISKEDKIGKNVSKLQSSHAVITSYLEVPESLHLHGAEVIIKNLKHDYTVAKTAFIFDRQKRHFCGDARSGTFSTYDFVKEVLDLQKAIPQPGETIGTH